MGDKKIVSHAQGVPRMVTHTFLLGVEPYFWMRGALGHTTNITEIFTSYFVPFIVSDYGESSRAGIRFMEQVVSMYKRKVCAAGRRADGLTSIELTARFRSEFKDRVAATVARGFGDMISHAGVSGNWLL